MQNMLKPLPKLKLKQIKEIHTLLINFYAWITYQKHIKYLLKSEFSETPFVQDLKIVRRYTSVTNSIHLLLAKYNYDSPNHLSGISKNQYNQLSDTETLLREQTLGL
jgi:hypothetical protein